jgi:hypothetical protein
VFGDNGVELNDHFQQFVCTPMLVSELPDDFEFKAAGGPLAMSNTVAVDRKDLLRWDGWKSMGRRHSPPQTATASTS